MKVNVYGLCLWMGTAFVLTACVQQKSKEKNLVLERAHAEEQLKIALNDSSIHNVIGQAILIKDSLTAIKVAEAVLFSVYGKENITAQRPYDIHFIDGHWILNGTLPENSVGGTFLMVINGMDGKVVRLTHGK